MMCFVHIDRVCSATQRPMWNDAPESAAEIATLNHDTHEGKIYHTTSRSIQASRHKGCHNHYMACPRLTTELPLFNSEAHLPHRK